MTPVGTNTSSARTSLSDALVCRRKRPAPNNLPGDADAWENHISDAEELPDAAADMGQGAKRRRPNPSSRLRPTADTRDIGPVSPAATA